LPLLAGLGKPFKLGSLLILLRFSSADIYVGNTVYEPWRGSPLKNI
jgi:hypothetical protein